MPLIRSRSRVATSHHIARPERRAAHLFGAVHFDSRSDSLPLSRRYRDAKCIIHYLLINDNKLLAFGTSGRDFTSTNYNYMIISSASMRPILSHSTLLPEYFCIYIVHYSIGNFVSRTAGLRLRSAALNSGKIGAIASNRDFKV